MSKRASHTSHSESSPKKSNKTQSEFESLLSILQNPIFEPTDSHVLLQEIDLLAPRNLTKVLLHKDRVNSHHHALFNYLTVSGDPLAELNCDQKNWVVALKNALLREGLTIQENQDLDEVSIMAKCLGPEFFSLWRDTLLPLFFPSNSFVPFFSKPQCTVENSEDDEVVTQKFFIDSDSCLPLTISSNCPFVSYDLFFG